MTRVNDALVAFSPTTMFFLGLGVVLYVYQTLIASNLELHRVTMCPRLVLYLHEYYRIISSSLFHVNLMHITMNLMSASAMSMMLEQRLGTIGLFLSTVWAILLSNVVYIIGAWLLSATVAYDDLMYQHSVGFSGVLFHYCVLESNMGGHSARSIFGVLNVPTYVYPWVL
jgi:membrane associated rhomboid family serine protease